MNDGAGCNPINKQVWWKLTAIPAFISIGCFISSNLIEDIQSNFMKLKTSNQIECGELLKSVWKYYNSKFNLDN